MLGIECKNEKSFKTEKKFQNGKRVSKRRNVNDTKVSTMTTNLFDFVVKNFPH